MLKYTHRLSYKILECHDDDDGNGCTKLASDPPKLTIRYTSTLSNYALKTTITKE